MTLFPPDDAPSERNHSKAILRLMERVVGELLTVASSIKLISEAADRIIHESGMQGIDISSFSQNCVSAIHYEMKNFMACFIHGSSLPNIKRIPVNPINSMIDALKGKSSSMPSLNKAPIYRFVNVYPGTDILDGVLEPTSVLDSKDVASAHKMAATLVADPFSPSVEDTGHVPFLRANISYLTALYPPFMKFDNWLKILFSEGPMAGERNIDSSFLETVLSEEFIPSLENYLLQEVSQAFTANGAEKWEPLVPSDPILPIGKKSNVFLGPFSKFTSLISRLQVILHCIPSAQVDIELLMTKAMSIFFEKCDTIYRGTIITTFNRKHG